MAVPSYVKKQADDARKLMSQPPPQEAPPEQKTESKERIDPTDYKARFSMLLHSRDDRYDKSQAELERVTQENEELARRIAEIQPPVQSSSYQVSDDERELLGETGASVVESVAKHVDSRFEEQAEKERVADQKAYERFVMQVDKRIPDWRNLQKDTAFTAWLGEIDEQLQVTRQSLLDRGVDTRDVELIGDVFDQYFTGTGKPDAQHEPSPELDPRSMDASGDVYEEWFYEQEIADHFTEKTKLARNRQNNGPAWDAIMERQTRIDDAIAHRRILKNK